MIKSETLFISLFITANSIIGCGYLYMHIVFFLITVGLGETVTVQNQNLPSPDILTATSFLLCPAVFYTIIRVFDYLDKRLSPPSTEEICSYLDKKISPKGDQIYE
jgi:hypothetical protein